MGLNLSNLETVLQNKVDGLTSSSTDKDVLLTSKSIEAATADVTVSDVITEGATQTAAAATQATNAAASASTATTQAGIATTKAGEAATSKTGADTAKTAAESAKASSETAETNALSSKNSAATSASTATTQAGISSTKAGEASTSASAAATSASGAASAATTAVNAVIDTAPANLNTLNESAAALGDDANYAATTTTALGNRYTKAETDVKIVELSPPTDISGKLDKTGGAISGNLSIGSPNGTAEPLVIQADSGATALSVNGRSSDNISSISLRANDGTTAYGYIQGRSDHIRLNTSQAGTSVKIMEQGNTIAKFDATGIGVTGTVTAAAFVGNGSNLTGIESVITQNSAPSHVDGRLWYDADDDIFSVSVDGVWKQLAKALALGGGAANPATSCKHILDTGNSVGSGSYWVTAGGSARNVYCDMTTDGGGWTLVWKLEDPGGHGSSTHLGEGYQSNTFGDRGGFQNLFGSGGGNIPDKTTIGTDSQRIMASLNSAIMYDWKGNLNSNLGSTNDGISIHNSGGAVALYDASGNSTVPDYACTNSARVGSHWYGTDKNSPGDCASNCDFGWDSDCRWENSPSVTNHQQMTMHIFVR